MQWVRVRIRVRRLGIGLGLGLKCVRVTVRVSVSCAFSEVFVEIAAVGIAACTRKIYGGQGQSGQAIKQFQITPNVNDL